MAEVRGQWSEKKSLLSFLTTDPCEKAASRSRKTAVYCLFSQA